MQCFKCENVFDNPENYFTHLKQTHNLSGKDRYVCTLCDEKLKEFGRYKKHVETCLKKDNVRNEPEQLAHAAFLEAYNDAELENQDISAFRNTIAKSALELVSKMSANMIIPRSLVFETILQVQGFINTIINGTTR